MAPRRTRVATGLSVLCVGYDDYSQVDPAEAETLEEGMTQPKRREHGDVFAETFIKKHARNTPGREEKPRARPSEQANEGRRPTASNPNAGLVQPAAFRPKEAWQALRTPVGEHLQALIRWKGSGASPMGGARTSTHSTLAEVGRPGEPRRELEIDECNGLA